MRTWLRFPTPLGWLALAVGGVLVVALLAGGLEPAEAGSLAALVHGRAAHDANPGGPVRALAVAHALGPTVAALLRS